MDVFRSNDDASDRDVCPSSDKRLVSVKYVSGMMGLSVRKIQSMISDEVLPSVKIGGRRLLRRDDVLNFIDKLEA